jgi:type IV pilus assembly protein PilX
VLAIGLLLLLVLTVLGITGITMATLELQMAGNLQYQERAFQAAEAGIEQAIENATFNTATPYTVEEEPMSADAGNEDTYSFQMAFDPDTGATLVPGGGYSLGTGFQAYHFDITAEGASERGARAEHQQSVYIIGPGGG